MNSKEVFVSNISIITVEQSQIEDIFCFSCKLKSFSDFIIFCQKETASAWDTDRFKEIMKKKSFRIVYSIELES